MTVKQELKDKLKVAGTLNGRLKGHIHKPCITDIHDRIVRR